MKWPMLTVLMVHLCVAKLLLGPEPGPAPTPDLDSELIPNKYNRKPCLPSPVRNIDMNKRFNEHHLCNLSEYGTDRILWTEYIQDICNNTKGIKSFLDESEKSQVEKVCSPSGGKVFEKGKNLCISKNTFSYVEVRWNDSCHVQNVRNLTQHIILACDKIDDKCLPVHFEKNPEKHQPNNNLPDCRRSSSEEEGWVEVEGNDE